VSGVGDQDLPLKAENSRAEGPGFRGQGSEVNLKAVYSFLQPAFHPVAAVVEDGLHPFVVAQDLGGKTGYAVSFGNGSQMFEQEGAYMAVLPFVPDN